MSKKNDPEPVKKNYAVVDHEHFNVDDLGVVCWKGYAAAGTYHSSGHDPFTRTLDHLNHVPHTKHSAIRVRDDLEIARNIALSIFGPDWKTHIFEIYDRFQAAQRLSNPLSSSHTDDEEEE